MQRKVLIEMVRRQIYGGFPPDDAEITPNLVNKWLDLGIAFAAQKNYTDNFKLDGIAYVNNSFYATYKNLAIEKDDEGLWKFQLPSYPIGIGSSEGVSMCKVRDNESQQLSQPIIMLSQNQKTYMNALRSIPNKLIGYVQGGYVYIQSTLMLNRYTAVVEMISGGVSSDMNSEVNVPVDYLTAIVEYVKSQILFQRMQPVDAAPGDGQDMVKTT